VCLARAKGAVAATMMEIQFDMELETPLGGVTDRSTWEFNSEGNRDKEPQRKKKNGEQNGDDTQIHAYTTKPDKGDDWTFPSTSSPSTKTLSTSHSTNNRSPGGRSPKAFRSSLPHTLTIEADRQQNQQTSSEPQKPTTQFEASSYQHLKMKYMRSLNFTPEELKSLRMKGRDRSQSVTLPLGHSMPIPVSGGINEGPFSNGGLTAAGFGLSASVCDTEEDQDFVPPHELVRHDDTFSVWHYEQKKIASKDAV
jgi:hypothetical protein